MTKIQEFHLTTSDFTMGAYRFGGKNTVRVYGDAGDVARGLFEHAESTAPAIIHISQLTGEEPSYWAERTFGSRMEALAFLFAQAIRFGLVKGARA